MNKVSEKIFELCPAGYATDVVIANLIDGSGDRLRSLIKRAIAKKEVLHIRRGLYCLVPKYQKHGVNPFSMAQIIYGPSYISLESALSYHGWIPEAVYTITSVSTKVSKDFSTDLGLFSFTHIPQRTFYEGVQRVSDGLGGFFFVANPFKALVDYVYVHRKDWNSIDPVIESLRIEPDDLRQVSPADMDRLANNYNSKRISGFIEGLKKDLGHEH